MYMHSIVNRENLLHLGNLRDIGLVWPTGNLNILQQSYNQSYSKLVTIHLIIDLLMQN